MCNLVLDGKDGRPFFMISYDVPSKAQYAPGTLPDCPDRRQSGESVL